MSQMSLVRRALNNRWLEEQRGAGHACRLDQAPLRAEGPGLIGTALYNADAALAAGKTCEATLHGRSAAESKPYAGWCGTGERITPRDPIVAFCLFSRSLV
jgi:hypothetical protein